MTMLTAASWPGNVRQMQNEVKRLVICAAGAVISVNDLREEMRGGADETGLEESAGDRR
jgi:DNA-binding NtrC family response regulator